MPSRVFIVGSARSGTTLVQAMLGAHPAVFTLSETHFFCESLPRGRRYRWTGLADRRLMYAGLTRTAELARHSELAAIVRPRGLTQAAYIRAYYRLLDGAAEAAQKSTWVEKTPHHIDFIGLIARHIPGARIVHVLRDGRDVVASQYHAEQQDREFWRKWPIEKMAEVWNADVAKSLAVQGKPAHLLVSYEAVIEDPEAQARRIAAFAGLGYDRAMLDHQRAAGDVLGWRVEHPWMTNVLNPLQDTRRKKYLTVFSEAQRTSMENILHWKGDVRSQFVGAQA